MSDTAFTQFRPADRRVALQVFRLETGAYLRAPLALFWTFVYPVMLFFILNAIFGGGDAPSGPTMSYADYLITGLAVMTMISTSLFSIMVVLVEQRAAGELRNYEHMPFSHAAYFAGYIASRLIVLVAFIALYTMVLSHIIPTGLGIGAGRLLVFTAYIFAGSAVMVGIGFLIAAATQRTATAHAVANLLNIPLIFLSDLFLPVVILPPAMQAVVQYSPLVAYVNGARGLYAGSLGVAQALPAMAAMLAAGAALVWLASQRFHWTGSK